MIEKTNLIEKKNQNHLQLFAYGTLPTGSHFHSASFAKNQMPAIHNFVFQRILTCLFFSVTGFSLRCLPGFIVIICFFGLLVGVLVRLIGCLIALLVWVLIVAVHACVNEVLLLLWCGQTFVLFRLQMIMKLTDIMNV